MNRSGMFLVMLGITLAGSCSPKGPAPELGEIYNAAAQQGHVDRNPIIVIPGVMGSRLVQGDDGQVVWGAFGGGAIDLRSAEGMRSMALPVSATGWPKDGVRADGALEELQVAFGFNFRFKAYSQMLAAFGAGGYVDQGKVDFSGVDYGEDHFTCFQFSYDWRRSCAENAAALGRFIEEKARYVESERKKRYGSSGKVKFDVIAHSMGGLVARYYLMYGGKPLTAGGSMPITWTGARRVEKMVLVGTPNGGSVYAYDNLTEGTRLAPLLPRIEPAVVATMPSAYELLPPEGDGALIDEHSKPIPYYSVGEWQRRGWGLVDPDQDKVLAALMPEVDDPAARQAEAAVYLKRLLTNARSFHRAINRPASPPAGVSIRAFAGDAEPTASRMQVGADGELTAIDWIAGDGTVTRKSVLRDMRSGSEASSRLKSPIKWSGVQFVFSDHVGMTRDPAFVDNVLYVLLEQP